jgi:hypothetical protein
MVTYIYFVKCPNCEDEHFDFFDEAKEFALGCLSQKPIITQTEVCRNDFGECTDSADLGTVWSWEDMMGDSESGYTEAEPTKSIFTKDDLKRMADGEDPEFDNIDNSVDCEDCGESETSEVSPVERKPIPEGMTIEQLVEEMEENEDTVECVLCQDLFDKSTCRKELNLGWLCKRCADDLVARGEGPVFKEDNYWDFLDEAAVSDGANAGKRVRLVYNNSKYHNDGEPYQLFDLKKLFKSSDIRELDTASINLIAKFDNSCKIIQETDKAYLVTVPCYYRNQQDRSKFEERPKYIRCWVPKTQTEFINESISEDPADVETLHDLGNTYDGGYPAEDNLTEAEELAKKPFDRWEKVELYYPEIGDGYEYITDKDEITDALVDIVTDEDVKQLSNGRWQTVDEITDYDSEHYYKDKAAYPVHEWTAFLENNYDDLFEKYEDEVYAALRKWAKEKYEKDRENIDADNYWLNYADHLYHSRKDAEFD